MAKDQPLPLPSPLSLVALCCRWPQTAREVDAIAREVRQVEDWDALLACARRHRVATQVFAALQDQPGVPDGILATLRGRALQLRQRGQHQLAELQRLRDILGREEVPFAELKGMTLGQLAYGRTDFKQSIDIDLLVPHEDAVQAIALLLASGYEHKLAGRHISQWQANALVHCRRDIELYGPHGVKLELHWRVTHCPALLKSVGGQSSWQEVQLPGPVTLSTLAMPELVAYIAVHGSLHNWARLKWLADFNALLSRATPADIEAYLSHADRVGAGASLRYALALCRELLGRQDMARGDDIDADPRLTGAGLAALQRPFPPHAATLAGKIGILGASLSLQRRLFEHPADSRALLRSHFYVERDVLSWPLPLALCWLYPVLRGPRWLAARITRGRTAE